MKRQVTAPTTALALLAAAGAAACGGGKSPATHSAERYRASANAICHDAATRLAALPRPIRFAALSPYLRRSIGLMRPAARRLDDLRAPARFAARAHHAASLLGGEVLLIDRIPTQLANGADPRRTGRSLRSQLGNEIGLARDDWRRTGALTCAREMTAAMARPLAVLLRAPPSPLYAHFLSAGQAICSRLVAFQRAFTPGVLHAAPLAARLRAATGLIDRAERALRELRRRLPAYDLSALRTLVSDTEQALHELRWAIGAMSSPHQLRRTQGQFELFNLMAQGTALERRYAAYGLSKCTR